MLNRGGFKVSIAKVNRFTAVSERLIKMGRSCLKEEIALYSYGIKSSELYTKQYKNGGWTPSITQRQRELMTFNKTLSYCGLLIMLIERSFSVYL